MGWGRWGDNIEGGGSGLKEGDGRGVRGRGGRADEMLERILK